MMLDVLSTESKVTKNGQVSLPAELRRRWDAKSVLFIDKGDHAVIVPMPEDPIRSLRGKYAGPGPTTDEMRAAFRREETEAEQRRWRAMGWPTEDPEEDRK
jgi:bifunctional DNA-binding transcriptional regulator/antitoxin component of YhaV-PrlF toxin-antitoxin module